MRRPRACSVGQPKARGRRKREQERGRPQRRARRGRGGPTHTTQNTRDGTENNPGNRDERTGRRQTRRRGAQPQSPGRWVEPRSPDTCRWSRVRNVRAKWGTPVPTRQGLIPGSKGSRRLPVSFGRPHGGPCEEVQSAGNEFEPGTSAGRSRNPEELNRPSEPDFHNLRGVPNGQDPSKLKHANHPGRKPASRKIPRREAPRVEVVCDAVLQFVRVALRSARQGLRVGSYRFQTFPSLQ